MKSTITDFLRIVDDKLDELNSSLPDEEYKALTKPLIESLIDNLHGESYTTFPHSAVFTYFKDGFRTSEGQDLWLLFFDKSDEVLQEMIRMNLEPEKTITYEKTITALHKIKENLELINIQKIMVNDIMTDRSKVFFESTQRLFVKVTESDEKADKLMEQVNNSKKELKITQNDQNTIRLEQKNTQKEFVTILGIFTTIIFAAFGGIQLLSGILTNISNSKLVVSIISGSFVFISIIIILSLLFSGLSKMANLSVRSCGCTDKKTCECKLSDKHPTIFYSFLLVLIVLPFALLSRYISFETLITNTIGVEKGINWSGIPRMLEVTFFALVPAIVFYTLDSKKIGPLIKFWTWPWIVSVTRGVKNRVLSWKWVRIFFKLDKSEKKSVVEENAAHTE